MKKIIMLISMLLALSATVVCASDIEVDTDIDYDNSIISVHCVTDARYKQALSIVLYEGTQMGSDITKIVKIADADADENGIADVELKLSSDIPSGEYMVSVAGGGSAKNFGGAIINYVKPSELPTILNDVNSANSADIKSVIEKYNNIFELPAVDGVYGVLLSAKKEDYDGKFTKVNDIVEALKTANALYELNQLTSEGDILAYIEANADVLGVDIDDTDFISSKQKITTAFAKLKKTNPPTGMASFTKLWNEAMAIGVINNTDTPSMKDAVLKYADVIGISKTEYESNCKKYGDVEINKALHGKDFETCSAIVTAYKNRVADLGKKKTDGGGGGTGGGGGSSSNRGSTVPTDTGFVVVTPNQDTTTFVDFTDLAEADWAIESIKKLAGEGIVSGYEDKTFKPNNAVSREEFATLIVRAFKLYDSKAECSFSDISVDDWCYSYVASITDKKYVLGLEDGRFGKGTLISRQDAATILYRVSQDNSIYLETAECEFSDGDDISEYASDAIGALNSAGIMKGFEDGSVKPKDSLTRAQAVKLIESLLNYK